MKDKIWNEINIGDRCVYASSKKSNIEVWEVIWFTDWWGVRILYKQESSGYWFPSWTTTYSRTPDRIVIININK